MMNCYRFELEMAGALGGELTDSDRACFENHLASCANCRKEYQSMAAAVERLQSLPAPDPISGATARETAETAARRRVTPRGGALYRYAATVLVAFAAGYAFRDSTANTAPAPPVDQPAVQSGPTLETALVSVHRHNPAASGLSAAMTAILSAK